MAYLPFYITPEQFQTYQQQRSETIANAPNLTRWMCKNVEHRHRHLRAVIWLLPTLLVGAFFLGILLTSSEPFWSLAIYIIIPLMIGAWAGYLSYGIDDRYDYTLSSAGLIYQKRLDEPLWGPRFVQIMAYIACGASILAVAIMGPLALAGSGGFLLLAFACTKKREIDVDEYIIPSEQFICARHHKQRKVLCLYSKYDVCETSLEQLESVFRVHTKEDSCLFYKNEKQLMAIHKILLEIDIPIEEVDDIALIFDFHKSPSCFYELSMAKETFHRDEALTRFDDPPPVGKSQEQVNKETDELFGKI